MAVAEQLWWGRHVQEIRWQAELARLLVDPVYRGEGVPHGDGGPALLIPGFLAGDNSLSVMAGWLRGIGHPPPGRGSRLKGQACHPAPPRGPGVSPLTSTAPTAPCWPSSGASSARRTTPAAPSRSSATAGAATS